MEMFMRDFGRITNAMERESFKLIMKEEGKKFQSFEQILFLVMKEISLKIRRRVKAK